MSGIYIPIPNKGKVEEGALYQVIVVNGVPKVFTFGGNRLIHLEHLTDGIIVPDHGRLVDADALGIREAEKQAYEAYLREKGEFFVEEPLLEYMRGRLEGLTDASGRVRFAPTIIPADKEGEG